MRTGSFFSNSNITLTKYLLMVLHWAYDDQVLDVCQRVHLGEKTGVQCFQYVRDICSWKLLQIPIRLGGRVGLHPNVCQIDESCFSHKPKVVHCVDHTTQFFSDYVAFVVAIASPRTSGTASSLGVRYC